MNEWKVFHKVMFWLVVTLAVIGLCCLIGGIRLLLLGEFNKAIIRMSVIAIQAGGTMGITTLSGFIIFWQFKKRRNRVVVEEEERPEMEPEDVHDAGTKALLEIVKIADEDERPIDWWKKFIATYSKNEVVKKACLNPMARARKRQKKVNDEYQETIYAV